MFRFRFKRKFLHLMQSRRRNTTKPRWSKASTQDWTLSQDWTEEVPGSSINDVRFFKARYMDDGNFWLILLGESCCRVHVSSLAKERGDRYFIPELACLVFRLFALAVSASFERGMSMCASCSIWPKGLLPSFDSLLWKAGHQDQSSRCIQRKN